MIDPVLRANATPIAPCNLPAAFNSSSRLSLSGVHGLLRFLGGADNRKGSDTQLRDDRTVPPCVSRRNKPSPIVLRTVKCMEKAMSTSHQGIDKHKGELQPSDKDRAQTAHKTSPDKSISHESTRDSRPDDQA